MKIFYFINIYIERDINPPIHAPIHVPIRRIHDCDTEGGALLLTRRIEATPQPEAGYIHIGSHSYTYPLHVQRAHKKLMVNSMARDTRVEIKMSLQTQLQNELKSLAL